MDEQDYYEAYMEFENISKELNELSPYDFLNKIIEAGPELNKVTDGGFKAYEIAKECLKWHQLTKRQREALTNIYAWHYAF